MTTSSDNLALRALAIAGAFNVAQSGEDFMASVRLPGLNQWSTAWHKNPAVALKLAVEKAEMKGAI